jgi:hypothetical protein
MHDDTHCLGWRALLARAIWMHLNSLLTHSRNLETEMRVLLVQRQKLDPFVRFRRWRARPKRASSCGRRSSRSALPMRPRSAAKRSAESGAEGRIRPTSILCHCSTVSVAQLGVTSWPKIIRQLLAKRAAIEAGGAVNLSCRQT